MYQENEYKDLSREELKERLIEGITIKNESERETIFNYLGIRIPKQQKKRENIILILLMIIMIIIMIVGFSRAW